jgi:catechol 2,3-dioxygenase-like lactoylglutathione lyase family enzyme
VDVLSLHHAGLIVADLERSRWFYGTVLGLEEVARPRNFRFAGAWFQAGETQLHLITAADTTAPAGLPDPGAGKQTGLALHFALEVGDVYALQAHLAAAGATVVNGPIPRGDGAYQLFVEDPDGHLIEFFQWIDDGAGAPERPPLRG